MIWSSAFLIPLALILAIVVGSVAAVAAWQRRHVLEEGPPGQQREALAKRLYLYVASFASLAAAATGLALVITYALDTAFGPPVLDGRQGRLALGLVLFLVWGLAWWWHWGRTQTLLAADPHEAISLLRQGYLLVVSLAAAGVVVFGVVDGLRQAFGAQQFRGLPIGLLVSWGGVWAYHLWLARAAPGAQPNSAGHGLYLHAVSLGGLVVLGIGVGLAASEVLQQAYDELFGNMPVLRSSGLWGRTRDEVAVLLTGGMLWASHWPYARLGFRGWWVRHLYLYLFALAGGAATCMVAAVLTAGGALAWGFGAVDTTAGEHFRYLTGAIPALLLGAGVWAYHWLEVQMEGAEGQALAVARRTYDYLLAALGLGALAGAMVATLALVVAVAMEAFQAQGLDPSWWRGRLALALAMGIVGVPAWVFHWWSRQSRANDPQELTATARRLYVRGAAVAALLAALGGLSHFLYLLLDALLEGRALGEAFPHGQWSLGVVGAAVLLGPYHWLVMLEDQRRAATLPTPRPPKAVTVLVPQDGHAFVRGLEARLGMRVRVLQRADPGVGLPPASAEELAQAAERVERATGARVLVVADAEGVRVYSY